MAHCVEIESGSRCARASYDSLARSLCTNAAAGGDEGTSADGDSSVTTGATRDRGAPTNGRSSGAPLGGRDGPCRIDSAGPGRSRATTLAVARRCSARGANQAPVLAGSCDDEQAALARPSAQTTDQRPSRTNRAEGWKNTAASLQDAVHQWGGRRCARSPHASCVTSRAVWHLGGCRALDKREAPAGGGDGAPAVTKKLSCDVAELAVVFHAEALRCQELTQLLRREAELERLADGSHHRADDPRRQARPIDQRSLDVVERQSRAGRAVKLGWQERASGQSGVRRLRSGRG